MKNADLGEGLTVSGRYRIVLRGDLEEAMSHCLSGMKIDRSTDQHGPVTVLVGSLRDQAELNGVLNWLCDQNHLLLFVESLDGLHVDHLTDEIASRTGDR